MSPSPTVCALPGCPTLTPGNYCTHHVNLTDDQEQAEITALQERRANLDQNIRLNDKADQ